MTRLKERGANGGYFVGGNRGVEGLLWVKMMDSLFGRADQRFLTISTNWPIMTL